MRKSAVLVVSAVVLAMTMSVAAQTTQTASQFYLAYRQAFDKAKAVDEILPFMSKERRDQMEATPAAERAEMFEMIKMFGAMTDLKILKETATPDGATLSVEAIDSDKAKMTGTITIVKEGGAWKLSKESWTHSGE